MRRSAQTQAPPKAPWTRRRGAPAPGAPASRTSRAGSPAPPRRRAVTSPATAASGRILAGAPVEPGAQPGDLAVLRRDHLLGEAANLRVPAVLDREPRHLDGALVVGDHG